MNLNLILAVIWAIIGLVLLFAPTINSTDFAGMDPQTRIWIGGFALVLACYNVIRWRFTRIRRQLDQDAHSYRPRVHPHRREEPPNPDFDFSDHNADKPPPPS